MLRQADANRDAGSCPRSSGCDRGGAPVRHAPGTACCRHPPRCRRGGTRRVTVPLTGFIAGGRDALLAWSEVPASRSQRDSLTLAAERRGHPVVG